MSLGKTLGKTLGVVGLLYIGGLIGYKNAAILGKIKESQKLEEKVILDATVTSDPWIDFSNDEKISVRMAIKLHFNYQLNQAWYDSTNEKQRSVNLETKRVPNIKKGDDIMFILEKYCIEAEKYDTKDIRGEEIRNVRIKYPNSHGKLIGYSNKGQN